MNRSVREAELSDISLICDYWFTSSKEHLEGMGVDVSKMLDRNQLEKILTEQFSRPLNERNAVCYIWEIDGEPVGHCNSNPTEFGKEAKMHLHIWKPGLRRSGAGLQLLRMTIPLFFKYLELGVLICEPYALNPAPNKTVEKAGFEFEREYITIPDGHSFEQPVKRWILTKERFDRLY